MKELYDFERRISALERRAEPGAGLDLAPATLLRNVGDVAARVGEVERGVEALTQAMAGALPADQVVARLDWLKTHADQTDEAGKMLLSRLEDLVEKLDEFGRRVAAIEARRGAKNG